jgi:hypothetical protein
MNLLLDYSMLTFIYYNRSLGYTVEKDIYGGVIYEDPPRKFSKSHLD